MPPGPSPRQCRSATPRAPTLIAVLIEQRITARIRAAFRLERLVRLSVRRLVTGGDNYGSQSRRISLEGVRVRIAHPPGEAVKNKIEEGSLQLREPERTTNDVLSAA